MAADPAANPSTSVRRLIPWLWLRLSMVRAIATLAVDWLAWPPAIWMHDFGSPALPQSGNLPAGHYGTESPATLKVTPRAADMIGAL